MYSTHMKGELACLAVQKRALEKGIRVSKPIVESRYDLILDDNGKLLRAQVRYCGEKTKHGAYSIKMNSECHHNGYRRTFSSNEIDMMLVYLADDDEIIWVGPELFTTHKKALAVRAEPSKRKINNSHLIKDLRW